MQRFERSLQDLQTGYIDLLLLHYPACWGDLCGSKQPEGTWQDRCGRRGGQAELARAVMPCCAAARMCLARAPHPPTSSAKPVRACARRPGRRSWAALEQLVREGKLRAIGASNFDLAQMAELVRLGAGLGGRPALPARPPAAIAGRRGRTPCVALRPAPTPAALPAAVGAHRRGEARGAAGQLW